MIPMAAVALLIVGQGVAQPRVSHAQPRLLPIARSPLKLRGTGFRGAERVRVVARGAGRRAVTRRVRARRSGRFVVAFGSRPAGCVLLLVRATGSKGSHASLGVRSPECAMP